MAGDTLMGDGARLDGAVIEASYAADRPPLLKRLADDRVPRLVDPQTVRFVGGRFLQVPKLAALDYAPETPITPDEMNVNEARKLARGALAFAQDRGTDAYLAPGFPLPDHNLTAWADLNQLVLRAACDTNGTGEIERKPLLAYVAPGAAAMRDPEPIIATLLDLPINGVYIQALRLNPTADSLEKLARFVQFCAAVRDAGLEVIVGRVGAFGLVLQTLGVTAAFDSGLGHAEAHDLADLNRPLTAHALAKQAEKNSGGGAAKRVYLTMFKTTMKAAHARALLAAPELRAELACSHGCCRFRALEELPDRARTHYLFGRRAEVDAVAAHDLSTMRIAHMEAELRRARDLAERARRVVSDPLPDFGHTDRWLRLLAREQHAAPVA